MRSSGRSKTAVSKSLPLGLREIIAIDPRLIESACLRSYATYVPEAELGVVMLANMNIFMPDRLEAMHQSLEGLAELAR